MGGSLSIFSGRSWALLQRLEFTPQETSSGIDFGPAGDLNGDGVPDLILGFPGDDRNGPDSGTVEILSGKNGKVLFRKSGQSGSFFGHAVSGVGDLDGDGRDDFMVVAPWNPFSFNPGSLLFFSGRTERLIRSIDGTLPGQAFGSRAAVLGDTNGDGVTDVIVGEPGQDIGDTDTGLVQVFSGADGSTLLFLPGGGYRNELGKTVERTGDVDRDGFADFFAVSQDKHLHPFEKIFSGRDGHVIYDFSAPSAPSSSLIPGGDFDLDGHPDFLDPGIRFRSHSLGLSVFKSDLPVRIGEPDPGMAGAVNTLTVTGLHPFAHATIVAGFRFESSFLPCFNGTRHIDVHISQLRLRTERVADANGVVRLSRMVPASLSGREILIKVLEFEPCRFSNQVIFTFH
ncbi:MAG: FG-GAP-like repeat-containing protein [Nitrospinota bacterium]